MDMSMSPTPHPRHGTKLNYAVDDNGCWIWQGYADKNGYGRVHNSIKRRVEWAHRYSFELVNGEIPPRMEIDHMCQVTLCVNPEHLQALTRAEHARVTFQRAGKDDRHRAAAHLRRGGYTYGEIADALNFSGEGSAFAAVRAAVQKGLVGRDEVPKVQRISAAERDEIRTLHALGIPQTAIGRFYGVDSSQVSRICNGFTSGHGTREAS